MPFDEPGIPGGEPPRVAEQRYIPASSLKADCGLPYVATEADIDRWLEALRKAAIIEIKKGTRISL